MEAAGGGEKEFETAPLNFKVHVMAQKVSIYT
jgi:hypothetical protein